MKEKKNGFQEISRVVRLSVLFETIDRLAFVEKEQPVCFSGHVTFTLILTFICSDNIWLSYQIFITKNSSIIPELSLPFVHK